jgi:putative oxidoreductase
MATSAVDRSASTIQDIALLVARLLIASLFLIVLYRSVFNFPGQIKYFTGLGMPVPTASVVLALIIEFVGGVCLLIGWQTRLAALLLALFTLAAALIAHTNFADANQVFHFLKNIAIVGGCLAIYVTGAGAYALDARKG